MPDDPPAPGPPSDSDGQPITVTADRLEPKKIVEISRLEFRVLEADGGRLKLEYPTLLARAGIRPKGPPDDLVHDVFARSGDRLIGFAGGYSFGGNLEIVGMVDPDFRRAGVGAALLREALALAASQGHRRALLVTPRSRGGGARFATRHGAVLDHSEHAMVLARPPRAGDRDPRIRLRPAEPTDYPAIQRILAAAFGWTDVSPIPPDTPSARTLVIDWAGAEGTEGTDLTATSSANITVIGTVRITADPKRGGGIYGFAIDPGWQGRGIGRDVLRQVCSMQWEQGVRRIGLEVEVTNEHALRLYRSVGFRRTVTEDYFALPME